VSHTTYSGYPTSTIPNTPTSAMAISHHNTHFTHTKHPHFTHTHKKVGVVNKIEKSGVRCKQFFSVK
jgi:hypothetical protein